MHIAEDSLEGHRIEEIIERQAVIPEEAVRIILRSHGLDSQSDGIEAAEMRRLRKAARRSGALVRPEDPEALLGCLSRHPDVGESITQFAYERRRSLWE